MLGEVSHILPIVHPQYYTAASFGTVHSKLALAFLTIACNFISILKFALQKHLSLSVIQTVGSEHVLFQ
jgi:hypothetical protein